MSVKTTYICDRCGKEYDEKGEIRIKDAYFRKSKVCIESEKRVIYDDFKQSHNEVDLCPECAYSLYKWFKPKTDDIL